MFDVSVFFYGGTDEIHDWKLARATEENYGDRKVGDSKFELCANNDIDIKTYSNEAFVQNKLDIYTDVLNYSFERIDTNIIPTAVLASYMTIYDTNLGLNRIRYRITFVIPQKLAKHTVFGEQKQNWEATPIFMINGYNNINEIAEAWFQFWSKLWY